MPSTAIKPVVTKIVGKFQVTVPTEVRDFFDLREGDVLEWIFAENDCEIRLLPKRPQLITPMVREKVEEARKREERDEAKNAKKDELALAGSGR